MTYLTLIRHGQTDWNLERRIQGTTDIPLNDTGREDAVAAAAALAGGQYDAIYSSPLSRARQTADIIATQLGLSTPQIIDGVREREFGEAEGMLVADYLEKFGGWHFEAGSRGIRGAESLDQVRDRALAELVLIAQESRRRSEAAESIIVVSHGGVIRSLLMHASGGALPREGEALRNGSVHRFVVEADSLQLVDPVIA